MENPWGIFSLFTTRDRFRLNSPFKWLWWHRYVVFLWSRSFFLRWITADPSPWGNFTPPTKHECGETLGDLEPVYDLFPITGENYSHCQKLWHRHVCGITAKQVVFLTVNHRGPFPWRELHSTDEIWVWRDPGGSWACLRPVLNSEWIWLARGCGTLLNKARGESGDSYGESSRTPHIKETWFWRDVGEVGGL